MGRIFDSDTEDNKIPQKIQKSERNEWIVLLMTIQTLMGIVCVIGGIAAAADAYNNKAFFIIGGIVAGMFMFTLAVVTAACEKYIRK